MQCHWYGLRRSCRDAGKLNLVYSTVRRRRSATLEGWAAAIIPGTDLLMGEQ